MVGVAQLVEHPVVVRDVAGSSPVAHPNSMVYKSEYLTRSLQVVFNTAPIDRNLGRAYRSRADRLTFCGRYDSRE